MMKKVAHVAVTQTEKKWRAPSTGKFHYLNEKKCPEKLLVSP